MIDEYDNLRPISDEFIKLTSRKGKGDVIFLIDPIYLITTFERIALKDGFVDLGDRRSVGFRHSFDIAEKTVLENRCDINETIYDYAVIEKLYPGLYQYAEGEDRSFYKFNYNIKLYEPIDEPFELRDYMPIGGIG